MSSRSTQYRRDREEVNEVLRSLGLSVVQRRSRSPIPNAPLRDADAADLDDVDLDDNLDDNSENDNDDDYDDNDDFDDYDDDDFNGYEDGGESDPEDNLNPNPDDPADIRRKLASWHLEYHVSERAMNDLLSWLKEYHFPHLPKTIKSLKTEAKLAAVPIQRMGMGQMCYFGIKKMIRQILTKNEDDPLPNNCGHLQFGIDGVPIAKSSGSAFWPILIKLREYPDVLPVAVYQGSGKPPDVHEYMAEFVTELDSVLKNPIPWKNLYIRFELSGFIMDAPAKSYVLDIKTHQQRDIMPPKKKLKYDHTSPVDEPVDDQEIDSNQQSIQIQQKCLEVLLSNHQQLRRLTKSVASIKTDVEELKRARGIRNNNILPIMGPVQMEEIEENFHLYEEDLRMIFNDYAAGSGLEFCRHFCNEFFDHVDHYNWSGKPAPNSGTPDKKPHKASSLKIVGLLMSVVTAKFNTDARSAKKFMIDALKCHYDARMKALAAARSREAQANGAQESGAVANE